MGSLLLVSCVASPAAAQSGIRATVTYGGDLGPVSSAEPLCLCLFYDADLTAVVGCLISNNNPRSFNIVTRDNDDYYLVAFLDLERNELLDPGEPFEIYNDRSAIPADAVTAMEGYNDIAIAFGDEHLPPLCKGDCDQSGEVTAEEVTALVGADLDPALLAGCEAGDGDGSATITVDEIVRAVALVGADCRL